MMVAVSLMLVMQKCSCKRTVGSIDFWMQYICVWVTDLCHLYLFYRYDDDEEEEEG